ncbi:MAG: hypothetical protein H5U20_02520, partial [Rhodobacteraceae bacterium]|nr:hypothetical protein [Paracoccaceae bacterium]
MADAHQQQLRALGHMARYVSELRTSFGVNYAIDLDVVARFEGGAFAVDLRLPLPDLCPVAGDATAPDPVPIGPDLPVFPSARLGFPDWQAPAAEAPRETAAQARPEPLDPAAGQPVAEVSRVELVDVPWEPTGAEPVPAQPAPTRVAPRRANGWTAAQDAEVDRMRREGATTPRIAEAIGRSERAVTARLVVRRKAGEAVPGVGSPPPPPPGAAPEPHRTWTVAEDARLDALRREGRTVQQIAFVLGRTRAAVDKRIQHRGALGVSAPPPAPAV